MDDAGDDDPGNNDIAVATTPIQTVKILKIHEPDLYYGNWDKLKGWLYQVQINIRFQQDWLKFKTDQVLYTLAYCRRKAWDFIKLATTQFLKRPRDKWIELTQDFFVCGKLKEQFTQFFGNIDAKQMVEQELFHLKQTKSITVYAAEF